MLRLGTPEQHSLEGRQAGWVEMFNDFHHGDGIGVWIALVHELSERIVHQTALVFEIASGDRFALGMRRQPAFAVAQKFSTSSSPTQ